MKSFRRLFLVIAVLLFAYTANAQCSICTRTAEQMGEKPAKGLNTGIIYLALAPLTIIGVVGYRWWKRNQISAEETQD